ncbi:hypothetical protein [Deinococcus roseus]|uniref:Uncharacterized protein n=1 Tax=Deinococcus roseus TaxID=392414 RepID=A0ABQ2CWZ3_9DEIO|nr:hypothetical protein [Deinococcus roseus]GGJ25068.1 hypothetical protein GCM10008938_08960 [Deinococcus roseus]
MQNKALTLRILQVAFVFSFLLGSSVLWWAFQDQPELQKWVVLGFMVFEGLGAFLVLRKYSQDMQE